MNKSTSPRNRIIRLTALSLALGATGALAQALTTTSDNETQEPAGDVPVQTFDTIMVVDQLDLQQAPWLTETDRQQLDSLNVNSLADFGARVEPGVNFSRTSNSVNIRGMEGSRVVTRVDGIRQSFMDDIRSKVGSGIAGGANAFDFSSLSGIEVVRGTDSTAVGSGAFGGVLDVNTLRPDDIIRSGNDFGFLGKTGYQSVDNSWLLNGTLAGKTSLGLKWLIQAGVQEGHEIKNRGTRGGYGTERNQVNPRSYTQQNYLLKLEQSFAGGHEVGLSGSYYERRDDITNLGAQTDHYAPGADKLRETLKRQSVALDYRWFSPRDDSWVDTAALKLYWQKQELEHTQDSTRKYDPIGAFYRKNSLEESMYGLDANISKAFYGDISQLWEFGFDYYHTTVKQSQIGHDSCPAVPSPFSPCVSYNNNQSDMPTTDGKHYGIWLQNTVGFLDDTITVMPALRFDQYKYTPKMSGDFLNNAQAGVMPSNSDKAWSPKVLVTWEPVENVALHAQYAIGFNAPTVTQLYSRYGTPNWYKIEGNPDLKPEKSRSWEFGARFGDDKLNGSITYFDTRYKNFIDDVNISDPVNYPFGGITNFKNLDNVRIYGIEARGHWEFHKGWSTYGSLAWSEGKDRSTNTYLNSVAPLKTILGLAYDHDNWGARGQLTLAAKRNNVQHPDGSHPDFKAPGYGVVDFTAYWKPSQVKGLTVQAGFFNIFNKTYWNALDVPSTGGVASLSRGADYYTQPGRNFAITLSYHY